MRTLLLSLLLLCGCATVNNAIAKTANDSLPYLVREYKREGLMCVQMAETKPEAEACIADVEKRWTIVWQSWATLRASEMTLGEWCDFVSKIDTVGIQLPEAAEAVCR